MIFSYRWIFLGFSIYTFDYTNDYGFEITNKNIPCPEWSFIAAYNVVNIIFLKFIGQSYIAPLFGFLCPKILLYYTHGKHNTN